MKLSRYVNPLILFAAALVASPFSSIAAAEPLQVAGLWRFLHGDQPAQPKAAPPKQLAKVSTASGVAVDAEVEGFLRAFANALKARDGQQIAARLSPQYTVDDLPPGRKAADMFTQAVEQIPGPEEFVVTSIERKGDLRIAKIDMRKSATDTKQKVLHFDAAGKLVWSDLFKLSVQRAGA